MKPEALSDLLRETMSSRPSASEAEIRQLCWDRCSGDADLVRALFDYWFGNSYRDFHIVDGVAGSVAVMPISRERPSVERLQQQRAETRGSIESLKSKLRSCLMDHQLSDGTLLRNATFGQCRREGDWLAAIGNAGQSNEVVGKKLTETDLHNLAKRFYRDRKSA
jgi:hypothetical protein